MRPAREGRENRRLAGGVGWDGGASMRPAREGRENTRSWKIYLPERHLASMRPAREGRENGQDAFTVAFRQVLQ